MVAELKQRSQPTYEGLKRREMAGVACETGAFPAYL